MNIQLEQESGDAMFYWIRNGNIIGTYDMRDNKVVFINGIKFDVLCAVVDAINQLTPKPTNNG